MRNPRLVQKQNSEQKHSCEVASESYAFTMPGNYELLLRIEVFYRAIKVPFMPIIVIINVTKRGIKRDLDRVLHAHATT